MGYELPRGVMEGVQGGSAPFVKILRDFGRGLSPLHVFAKGKERKNTFLQIEEESWNPMLAFSLL